MDTLLAADQQVTEMDETGENWMFFIFNVCISILCGGNNQTLGCFGRPRKTLVFNSATLKLPTSGLVLFASQLNGLVESPSFGLQTNAPINYLTR